MLVGVSVTPAVAVTNPELSRLADAIEAAKSTVIDERQRVPSVPVEPRRSCGWWTLEGQQTMGGAQHALLCTPPTPEPDLDGA